MNDPIDFHTANTVLDQYPDVRYPSIVGFFVIGQCAALRLFLRLQDDYTWQAEALKAAILPQHATFWQAILGFFGNPFVMRFAFIGRAQEDDPAARIHQQYILDGMLFLLTTVIDGLLISIFWSCYRSFGSILAKKGGASRSSGVVSACSIAANSAAVRAGSKR